MVNNFIAAISHFFAENKSLSYLLLVSIAVFGVAAFVAMPKQYNPEIIRPAFVVSFVYEGATPETTVERAGYELVEKLQVINGVEDIYTKVTDGSVVMSTVMFEVGYDKATAKVDLLTQLKSHSALAAGAISNLSVTEINPETIPVLQIVFSSPELTVNEVREKVLLLRGEILKVADVSELDVVGGDKTGVVVEVDPLKLNERGVTLAAVKSVLASASLRVVAGEVEGERFATKVVLDGGAKSVEDIASLPVASGVMLREVATVYEGAAPNRSYTWYASKEVAPTEVVILSVAKREGSSAPTVTADVLSVVDGQLATAEFASLSYEVASDDGVIAQDEISGLTTNLMQSVMIVGVVLFLFLSTRAALVVLITVPLTFLSVLAIGYLAGESMNRITLFALILSLGLLVDAAIVVVDNIYDHLKRAHEHGLTVSLPKVAAGAVREVGVGLVLSAITSVVVFLPMNYITGMMGPYMGPIAFFVPMALIASLLIAIVLTPFIAIKLLKHDEKDNFISAFFRRRLDALTTAYTHFLHRIAYEAKFRSRLLVSVLGIFLLTLILPALGFVHFQMLPKADRNQFYVYIDAPEGTSRDETNRLSKTVSDILLTHPEVKTVEAFVATSPIVDFNGLFKGAPSRVEKDQATLRVNLSDGSSRDISSTVIASEVRASLASALKRSASYVRIMEEPPGPPVAATFEAKLEGEPEVVAPLRAELKNLLTRTEGVVDIYTSAEAPVEEVRYVFNREALSLYGVDSEEFLSWYQLTSSPVLTAEFVSGPETERTGIYLTLPATYSDNLSGLESLPISTRSGDTTFGALVSKEYTKRVGSVFLEGAREVEYVTAEVEGRSIVYVMIELMRGIMDGQLGSYQVKEWGLFGVELERADGAVATITWGGEWEMTLENFRDLGMAMMAALFLVYAVLVAQYGSFATPGYILLTVPLGLIGIFTGFLFLDQLFGIYLTATALIGFIALIGIVVNNAIIYLEYVEQSIAEGTSYADALIASGTVRLRPILLTSLTTVLGSLTIAADPVWSGLAWSFVFGLSLSTALTLIVFPAVLLHFKSESSIATN